jgi:indole-3-glycerol phosphate synthase
LDILEKIIGAKRQRLAAARKAKPDEALRLEAMTARREATPHVLARVLESSGINIIAEFKRRSPSKGMIRAGADPADIAVDYQRGGAAAISVLTEEDYFEGALDDLRAVRRAVKLPILRKDFVFDEYQVYESAAAGADALLLIVAALTDGELRTLREITEERLGMDALVEVHTSEELKRAEACGASLIGVNNRDLRTFTVSLETSVALAREAPAGATLVSESGLNSAADLDRLQAHGYRGFLIGETLMRAERPALALQSLIARKEDHDARQNLRHYES